MSSRATGASSRRSFLGAMAAGAVGVASPVVAPRARQAAKGGAGIAGRYEGLRSDAFFEGDVKVAVRLDDPDSFTEGPAVAESGEVFFTNIPASHILAWNPESLTLRVVREQSGRANGLMFDPAGRLLACEGGAGRVTRTDLQTGEMEVLADSFEEQPLEAPNDLVLDRAGRIYFTSRPSASAPSKGGVNAVYRIDPDRSLHRLLRDPEVHTPNGIALSPDEQILYLIDADPDAGRNRSISAFELSPDGTLHDQRTLIDFYPGRSGDGMCIDAEGNLYVAAGLHERRGTSETLDTRPGVHVISPQGKLMAYAQTPIDTVTNCSFGGEDRRTLFVTCGPLLLSLRTRVPAGNGAP